MTNILLIRHAECKGNELNALSGRTNFELTEYGKEMVKNLLEELKEYKIDKIYSSPLVRCIDTIKPTAEYFKLKINICDDLIEKSFGIYDGKLWKEIERINPEIIIYKEKYNEIVGIEKQETTEEVKNRMNRCMYSIARQNEGHTVAICSHGCAIETFIRGIDNIDQSEQREKYGQHNVQINILEFKNNEFQNMGFRRIV